MKDLPDADRTVIAAPVDEAPPGGATVHGPDLRGTLQSGNALPLRTFLGQFELTGVLGEGGFSIVYSAWDHSLERHVAVKEYIPASLATRDAGLNVTVKSERHRETFEAGLRSFVNEARLLAGLDHPSLVKVYQFWEDRGTAFMVMPLYRGRTLLQALRERGTAPDETWLLQLLLPLTEALMALHAQQCYHRDISPDNIMLLADSEAPLLLDFGAARRVIGDRTQTLTVILKPGYAPLEQYAEVPGMHQGPWTDVYALAAVVHYAICGATPPVAVGRLVNDTCVPLVESAAGRYSPAFLAAIDRALTVRPEDRTPSVQALRAELGLDRSARDQRTPDPQNATRTSAQPRATSPTAPAPHPWTPRTSRRTIVAWTASGLTAVAVVAASVSVWRRPMHEASSAAVPPARAIASQPAAAGVPVSVATEMPAQESVARQEAVTAPHTFNVPSELDAIVAAATPGFEVQANARASTLRIQHDLLAFSVASSRDGFVYVLVHGPDGSLTELFPNRQARSNHISAGVSMTLPQANWQLKTTEPIGRERFLVLVSERPREFGPALNPPADAFRTFDTSARAAAIAASLPTGRSLYAGRAVCPPATPCSEQYGATSFDVEVVR